jgi:hypothetical protein
MTAAESHLQWLAVTDQERELLRLFRAMTPTQQKAALAMVQAMVAFRDAMREAA